MGRTKMNRANPGPNRRLTPDEAMVVLFDAVKDQEVPFVYPGGWAQVMSDLVCIDKGSLINKLCRLRARKLSFPSKV